jgi:Aldehyde dehydrogenase family
MILGNRVAADNVPSVIMFDMHRDVAARRPGVLTTVGVETFVDPVREGCAMNAAAAATQVVARVTFGGETWLHFANMVPDKCILGVTTVVGKAMVSLEPGGKSPQVIFADADMESATDAVTFGVYFNQGECCDSGGRIIVHEDVAEDLIAHVVALSRQVAFGDLLAGLTFNMADEAIALCNDATYGLSAGVWSENMHTCLDFARRAPAATIWKSTWMDGFPEMTFGGMKQRGQGREIGPYGLDAFLEVNTVAMRVGRTRAAWAKTP